MGEDFNKTNNKSFGVLFFLIFLIISIYPIFNDGDFRNWSFIISLIFLFLGLINSKILSPLNRIWMKLGIFLGNFISPIIMGFIFFTVITPISLIMKILGKDILNLKKNNKKTYWIKRLENENKMKNQF